MEIFLQELAPLVLVLIVFGLPLLVDTVIKIVFAKEIYGEEKEERYEKYREMFNEMKKG